MKSLADKLKVSRRVSATLQTVVSTNNRAMNVELSDVRAVFVGPPCAVVRWQRDEQRLATQTVARPRAQRDYALVARRHDGVSNRNERLLNVSITATNALDDVRR